MSTILNKIPSMSIEDINKLRVNARTLLDQPGRYQQASAVLDALDKELERRNLPGMISTFLEQNPDGFYGQVHREQERDYKDAASAECKNLLGKNIFGELVSQQDFNELISRACKLVNMTNFIQASFEKPRLIEAIKNSPEVFFPALYDLLWGDDEIRTRFPKFLSTLDGLNLNKWTYATYFLFLSDPDENMFVKPEMLKKSLEKSQYPLEYESTPSVELYLEIIKFSKWLKGKIHTLKPRDMIDIHSFMWHMAPTGKWSED
jgi:hypothetical protein